MFADINNSTHWCGYKTSNITISYGILDNNLISINNMDIKEKFLTSIKKEPEKSFRKAGITNGDDMLTSDGQAVFLCWLLQKNGTEFKKDVVDDILKEEEKEKKC